MIFSEFRIALIQLAVTANKAQNLLRAKDKIKEAVSNGAKIVALPVIYTFWRNFHHEIVNQSVMRDSCNRIGTHIMVVFRSQMRCFQ